jgi:pheromone a factor receptor
MTIYTLYKHNRQFNQILSSFHGLTRGRYIRLMVLFSAEMLGIIPLGTYFMVSNAKMGVKPWKSWADTHSHYSVVVQVPSSVWKKDSNFAVELEFFRWSVVACAFNFFILLGTTDEARQHYRLLYAWLTGRTTRADPPAPIPLHFPDTTKPTMFADSDVDKV